MNREILFRGKRKDNSEWAHGYYNWSMGKHYITVVKYSPPSWNDPGGDYYEEAFEVAPESVGQYTGLKDKNGKEIYEGDIVQFISTESHEYDAQYDYGNYRDTPIRSVMKWSEEACGFRAEFQSRFKVTKSMLEIVGNQFEHPHLLTQPQGHAALHIMTTDSKDTQAEPAQETSEAAETQNEATENAEEGGIEG